MKNTWKFLTGGLIVIACLLGFSSSSSAIMPPDGDSVHKIYVDNVLGDDSNDGSRTNPYRTVDWAFRVMNGSGAPAVEMFIRGTDVPYETDGSINFKRDQVDVHSWGRRPLIMGIINEGAWHLPDMALDSQSGIYVKNIDFYNVVTDFYTTSSSIGGMISDVVLSNLTFKIDRPDLLDGHSVIWFHHNDFTGGNSRPIYDIKVDRVRIAVRAIQSDPPVGDQYDAIRLEDVNGGEVYRSGFYGSLWDAGIKINNASHIRVAQNRFLDVGRNKMALYRFNDVDESAVYNRMQ